MQSNNSGLWRYSLIAMTTLGLSACGGSDGSGDDGWIAGVYRPASDFENSCAQPRTGFDPTSSTGQLFPDRQGSTLDENNWLRSISNDLYLWYNEITDINPSFYSTPEYFDRLVTEGTTSSGTLKDQFHFSVDSDEWYDQSQNGVSAGYGTNFAVLNGRPPNREVYVVFTEPDSPAAYENLTRGARIIEVDGVDLLNGDDTDTLNGGLFPATIGETHTFVVQDLGSSINRTLSITSDEVTSVPVQNVSTLPGDVGYFTFNDHIATAEDGLFDAIDQLVGTGVTDLVIDLRYNGGGYLAIASELAYMIAGDTATKDKTFELIRFNDKHPTVNPVTNQTITPTPFINTTVGFSKTRAAGEPLPELKLSRVFVLTGANTCSASESVINGLRGIDVEVYQFGTTTCGKPYGFYELPNCGVSYFTIQFEGSNAKGFSSYADGFRPQNTTSSIGEPLPGCQVGDDLTHDLGDPAEAKLAAALAYRDALIATGDGASACPPPSSAIISNALISPETDLTNVDPYIEKNPGLEGKVLRTYGQYKF